jgi:hypothetical protein
MFRHRVAEADVTAASSHQFTRWRRPGSQQGVVQAVVHGDGLGRHSSMPGSMELDRSLLGA